MQPRELLKWAHYENRQFAKLQNEEGLKSEGCVSDFTNTCYYQDAGRAFLHNVGSPEECKEKCTDARCHAVVYFKNNRQCLTLSSDPFVSAENDWVPIPKFVTSTHEGSDIYAKIANENVLSAQKLEALKKSKVGAVGNVVHIVYKDRGNVTSEYCYRVIQSNRHEGHNMLAYPIHVSGEFRPNPDLHFKPFLYLENHYITAVRRWVVEMKDSFGTTYEHEMGLGCDIQGIDGLIAHPALTVPSAEPIVSFPAQPVDPVFSCGIPNDGRDSQRTERHLAREHIMVIGDSITSSLWNTQLRCSINPTVLDGRCTLHAHLQHLHRESKVSAFGYPGMALLSNSPNAVTNKFSLSTVHNKRNSWDEYKQALWGPAKSAYTGQTQCELPVDSLYNAILQYENNMSFLEYVNRYSNDHHVDHLFIMLGTNDIDHARKTDLNRCEGCIPIYDIDTTSAADSLDTIIRNVTLKGQKQVYIVTPPRAWLDPNAPEWALYEELDSALQTYATFRGYNFVTLEHASITYYDDPVGKILNDGIHPDAKGLYSIAETFTAAKPKNSWNGRKRPNTLSLPAEPAPVQRTTPTATLPAIPDVQGPVGTLPNAARSTLPSAQTLRPVDEHRAPRSASVATTGAALAAPIGTTAGAAQKTKESKITGEWSQKQDDTPTMLLIIFGFGVLAGFMVLCWVGLREKRQSFRQRTQDLKG